MNFFTVHRRRKGGGGEPDLVLVKDGFCWQAFLFTALWALAHRMWVAAALLFALAVGLDLAAEAAGLGPATRGVLGFGLMLLVGGAGNDLRRLHLARKGWEEIGPACGAGRTEAELRAASWMREAPA